MLTPILLAALLITIFVCSTIIIINERNLFARLKEFALQSELTTILELDEFEEHIIDLILILLNEKGTEKDRLNMSIDVAQYLHANGKLSNAEFETINRLKNIKSAILCHAILWSFKLRMKEALIELLLKKLRYD